MYSVYRFKDLGFKVISSKIIPGLMEGVVSQRNGYHGEDIKKMWLAYSHLSVEEASIGYEVEIIL